MGLFLASRKATALSEEESVSFAKDADVDDSVGGVGVAAASWRFFGHALFRNADEGRLPSGLKHRHER